MNTGPIITPLALGVLKANAVVCYSPKTGRAVITDPGGEAHRLTAFIAEQKLTPAAILLTHGHYDHILAADALRRAYGVPLLAAAAEAPLLADPELNVSAKTPEPVSLSADGWLANGDVVDEAGFPIKVLATPGHTAGSLCFFLGDADAPALLSGDTLFQGSFGRYDLPTGSLTQLADSILGKLFTLPDGTAVYPGHGNPTAIGREKRENMIRRFI